MFAQMTSVPPSNLLLCVVGRRGSRTRQQQHIDPANEKLRLRLKIRNGRLALGTWQGEKSHNDIGYRTRPAGMIRDDSVFFACRRGR